MKTILLPECLLLKYGISKTHWPKVICLTSFIQRNKNGRIISEIFEFEFNGTKYSYYNFYNSNKCVDSGVHEIISLR